MTRLISPYIYNKADIATGATLSRLNVLFFLFWVFLAVGPIGAIPMACYPCLVNIARHAARMRTGRLDLIKLCAEASPARLIPTMHTYA